MIEGVDAAVTDALLSHLQDADIGVAIAWPGARFTPPETAYLQVSLFPLPTSVATLTSHDRHDGIMQVSVFCPRGEGVIEAMEIAGCVLARFKRTTRIEKNSRTVRIDRAPSVAGVVQETGWLQIPITIPWTAYVRL